MKEVRVDQQYSHTIIVQLPKNVRRVSRVQFKSSKEEKVGVINLQINGKVDGEEMYFFPHSFLASNKWDIAEGESTLTF